MPNLDPDLRALQEVRDAVARAKAAQKAIAGYSQAETDGLCRAMAEAGRKAAHDLARLAVEETGIGRVHYKVLKNLFGSVGVWESIEHEPSVGVIHRDPARGLVEVATPVGVIAAIVPTTNPTSTVLGKSMIAVKGRNAVVHSPHPRAKRCIGETAEVLRRALEREGAPADLVQALSNPTIESTGALMKHRDVALILATGGSGLVRAAYSSGKPAYGVGPGNVPCYVDRSADLESAAHWIVSSQSFDNATFCCSEQALVLDRPIAESLLQKLIARGAHLCDAKETEQLARYCNQGGHMNPDVVGQDPWKIARAAGFEVPRSCSLLLAHQGGVGKAWPLSIEILCPLLSVHVVDGWQEGCRTAIALLEHGGLGHTLGVWSQDEAVLEAFFLEKPASRIVANGPCSQGAVGYSTNLVPSLSLGCGPQAGNITSDNITARHLLNIKRVGFPKADWAQRFEQDLATAAQYTGELAPRGSGLPGDPALGSGATAPRTAPVLTPQPPPAPPTPSAPSALHWQGNPASTPKAAPAPSAAAARQAPRFTAPASGSGSGSGATSARRPAGAPAPKPAPGAGVNVGETLTAQDIQGIMAHAGSGCPLGPCQGCPHQDVVTGACTA